MRRLTGAALLVAIASTFVCEAPRERARARSVAASEAEVTIPTDSGRVLVGACRLAPQMVRRAPSANHLFLDDADGDPRGYARLANRALRGDVVRAIGEWIARHYARAAHV